MNTNTENEKKATIVEAISLTELIYDAAVGSSITSAKARLQRDDVGDLSYLASILDGVTNGLAELHVLLRDATDTLTAHEDEEKPDDSEAMVADFEQVAQEISVMDDPESSLNEFDIAELFAQDERTMTQIANDAGLTSDTVKRFVEGAGKPRNKTLRGLEKAFNMEEGTLDVFA